MNRNLKKYIAIMLSLAMLLCPGACGKKESYEALNDSQFTEIQPENSPEIKSADKLRDREHPVQIQYSDLKDKYAAEPDDGIGMDGAGVWTLQEVRDLAEANGDICSAILLGYSTDISSLLTEMDLTDYPFIQEIPKENYIELTDGGTEIYCIIPTDPSASLAVNEWIMDETNGFYGETGQVLYRSESGDPILLRANPSDAVPSTQVVIVDSAGESLDWNPSISLYDGKMQIPWYSPGVTDLTDYGD